MWRAVFGISRQEYYVWRQHQTLFLNTSQRRNQSNLIDIKSGSFYRSFPSAQDNAVPNPVLFPDLSFELRAAEPGDTKPEIWSVISPSSLARTTFLQILAAQHICVPPNARRYPHLSQLAIPPQHGIKYVGFDAERGTSVGGNHVRGAYLSARYESRREETDFSLYDYLTGHTELNALEREASEPAEKIREQVIDQLNLRKLLHMPVANLSNGQTRRARIAKALISRPEVLLLDGPFMGLDPTTASSMQTVLRRLAEKQSPTLVMSLRPEDQVPAWVSHLILVDGQLRVVEQGPKDEVCSALASTFTSNKDAAREERLSRDAFPETSPTLRPGDALVEMQGVQVAYGNNIVLGDWTQLIDGDQRPGLWWSLRRGQRCGLFGANGSGKTTMLSLITSDHPQAYSQPIKLFGRPRLPGVGEVGISLFDIQRRMGHSSPEVHAFFPKQLTVRRMLESAWADAPLARPMLTGRAKRRVDAFLRWFADELNPNKDKISELQELELVHRTVQNEPHDAKLEAARAAYRRLQTTESDLEWSTDVRFGEMSFSNQRLLLFMRAIIAEPDLVVLDEALSGIDENTRDRALLFLSHGEKIRTVSHGKATPSLLARIGKVEFGGLTQEQALLAISHAREDVPGCVREWICLPEPGEGKCVRSGTLQGPLELNTQGWGEIWGSSVST